MNINLFLKDTNTPTNNYVILKAIVNCVNWKTNIKSEVVLSQLRKELFKRKTTRKETIEI